MATNSTSSRYGAVSSVHIDSLISYVLDTKPYRTKLSAAVEEYLFYDRVNVSMTDQKKMMTVLGPDFLNKSGNPARDVWANISPRPTQWLSAMRYVMSDGSRSVFPVPTTVVPKLLSESNQAKFIVGKDEDTQIPGLTRGVYSTRRFDGEAPASVLRNGTAQTESIDFHVSHGAFSFTVEANQRWQETNIANIPAFGNNPGELAYDDVLMPFGTITGIVGTTYEEFTLTWSAAQNALMVVGSVSGNIGQAQFNVPFTSTQVSFTFVQVHGEPAGEFPPINDGDKFVLTPRSKITISPTAPQEIWTIIKTNPQALVAAPTFKRTGTPAVASTPSLNVFTYSLEWTPQSTWTISFVDNNEYTITAVDQNGAALAGYPVTAKLIDGCSYRDDNVHFTFTPPSNGFIAGDSFTFSVKGTKGNFLVYGSVSGWQAPATLDSWYWNGKIGFKIPSLSYFAFSQSATIVTSPDGLTWTPAVTSSQELAAISYIKNQFIAAGLDSIVAHSTSGYAWDSIISGIISTGERMVVIGQDGFIATTSDGLTWYQVNAATSSNLLGMTVVPATVNGQSVFTSPQNLIVIVGDNGTILTSVNGVGWAHRESGTNTSLNAVAWNTDWVIAVGDGGTILRSSDRINWTPSTSGVTANLRDVKFLNGMFYAVGDGGTLITSADGITWTQRNSTTTANLNSIDFGNGIYVAVGVGGYSVISSDGIAWRSNIARPMNAVIFGGGLFVGVGHRVHQYPNFTPNRPVHSTANPGMYSAVFRPPTSGTTVVGGTIEHNSTGFKQGFRTGVPWSDGVASFTIGYAPTGYLPGERIDIVLAPSMQYAAIGYYDQLPYEATLYDMGVGLVTYADDKLQELFPLYHNQGSIIFPGISAQNDGDVLTIDKVENDNIKFQFGQGTDIAPGALAADASGWVPLEFRYRDRGVAVSGYDSPAVFPDFAAYIDAYLASDPTFPVFSISQPRYETTLRPSLATLTFSPEFFSQYLPERQFFGLRFGQADSFGQTINVKVTENIWIYARINLILEDVVGVKILDDTPGTWEVITDISFADKFNAAFAEGGIYPKLGYDLLPFDVAGYDQPVYTGVVYGIIESPAGSGNYVYTGVATDSANVSTSFSGAQTTEIEDSEVDTAGTVIADEMQIMVSSTATDGTVTKILNVTYDKTEINPAVGLLITQDSNTLIVTHNLTSGTPTVLIQPVTGTAFTVTPTLIYTPSTGSTTFSFSCSVPLGTAPYRLTLS